MDSSDQCFDPAVGPRKEGVWFVPRVLTVYCKPGFGMWLAKCSPKKASKVLVSIF